MSLQKIAFVTLAGSIVSCISTACVLASYIIYRRQLFNFRHALVLNLAVADFVNSLNNSISGIIFVETHKLESGTPCSINGMIGQLSVQASDFSILAIALVTLLTVTRRAYMPGASQRRKIAICGSIWILPLITSITPTIMGEMQPVGGNWCWISVHRSDLRYGMGHFWRFLVIFCTIAIYITIWFYLRCHFKAHHSSQDDSSDSVAPRTQNPALAKFRRELGFRPPTTGDIELGHRRAASHAGVVSKGTNTSDDSTFSDDDLNMIRLKEGTGIDRQRMHDDMGIQPIQGRARASTILKATPTILTTAIELQESKFVYLDPNGTPSPRADQETQTNMLHTNTSEFPIRHNPQQVEREIKRMMLLNGYPLLYVLLWIPGLVNRLMEASGRAPSAETSAALQVSTQFVGLANALTYGFNHYLRDRLKGIYLTPVISRVRRKVR